MMVLSGGFSPSPKRKGADLGPVRPHAGFHRRSLRGGHIAGILVPISTCTAAFFCYKNCSRFFTLTFQMLPPRCSCIPYNDCKYIYVHVKWGRKKQKQKKERKEKHRERNRKVLAERGRAEGPARAPGRDGVLAGGWGSHRPGCGLRLSRT